MSEDVMLGKKVWAVVGANQDPDKYGNKILKALVSRGYMVYPVNPLYEEVEGLKCYKDLSSIPEVPEVIDMVVSPKRGKAVLEEAAELGIKYIWLQPGTYNDEIMELIESKGLIAAKACILMALG